MVLWRPLLTSWNDNPTQPSSKAFCSGKPAPRDWSRTMAETILTKCHVPPFVAHPPSLLSWSHAMGSGYWLSTPDSFVCCYVTPSTACGAVDFLTLMIPVAWEQKRLMGVIKQEAFMSSSHFSLPSVGKTACPPLRAAPLAWILKWKKTVEQSPSPPATWTEACGAGEKDASVFRCLDPSL